jgi:hypothetical protein
MRTSQFGLDQGRVVVTAAFPLAVYFALPKGEGRVRVSGLHFGRVAKPLTSILSPFPRGEAGRNALNVER